MVDQNQGVIQTAVGPAGPFYPGLSSLAVQGFGVHTMQSSSNSDYNSLRASVTKRYSNGLTLLASYTWSHSLDDYSGDPTGTSDVTVVPGNQALGSLNNYASSDFDRRHRFVFSGIYDLPKFYKGASGFARQAVNGWELASILTLQSGTPFSVLTNDTAFVQARADFVPGCNPVLSGSVQSRLSGTSIPLVLRRRQLPPPAALAIQGATSCAGPIRRTWTFRLSSTSLSRSARNLNSGVSSLTPLIWSAFRIRSTFWRTQRGQIVETSTGPRVIQFALKVNFRRSMPLRGLNGKVVIVTGAAAGIGRATARRFAQEGCGSQLGM